MASSEEKMETRYQIQRTRLKFRFKALCKAYGQVGGIEELSFLGILMSSRCVLGLLERKRERERMYCDLEKFEKVEKSRARLFKRKRDEQTNRG